MTIKGKSNDDLRRSGGARNGLRCASLPDILGIYTIPRLFLEEPRETKPENPNASEGVRGAAETHSPLPIILTRGRSG